MSEQQWSTENIPDQSGRVAIITGASSGIGQEAAQALAEKGARVILAVRDDTKGAKARDSILKHCPSADVQVKTLDLANLSSVKTFANSFLDDADRLDMLVNNAGVMMCPYDQTLDGFEIQFGTNHLGHFALTAHLLPLLKQTNNSRVVMVSSLAHHAGKPDFDDLNWQEREYNTSQAYCDSKLANMYFAFELANRLAGSGNTPMVTAAHPGWSRTDLQRHMLKYRVLGWFMGQNAAAGALPTLRAAIDPNASPRDFFGPGGKKQMKGAPVKVPHGQALNDDNAAKQLWQRSEEMTGIHYY